MRLCSCKIEELNDIIIQNQLELNETRSELSETKKSFTDSLAKTKKSFTDSLSKTKKSFTDSLALFYQQMQTLKSATGVFTAPSSGMYAFTWTLCVDSRINDGGYGEFGTELVVDGQICGTLHADTESHADDACSTGFIIKYVRKTGKVYLRNNDDHQGSFLSKDSQTRTTFSGWKLN
ncbi:unnamed protein product [Mytilus edulis]|uniref:C1q domain-containing protein n=1 Tax=Mytilus edulis TaxID=6550 RepID=A0A8S3Q3Z5_MYTED|nr:unnamed protein product [Mytilus edulis]